MLTGARVAAVVPVADLEPAVEFYGQNLGLGTPQRDEMQDNPGANFSVGGGGDFYIYKSPGAGQSRHTVAALRVDDLERTERVCASGA